jgi:dynein heavy chain
MEYKTIEIAKKYGTSNFRDDVKAFMKVAGIKGSGISFVMTDTQIIDEAFIENLNNLLNTGTIPNLMLEEDNTEIENDLRPVLQQRKLADGKDAILQFFTDRVREFLHICLCMSPVGDTLRIRCRNFPSLINCCTLDWFGRWPEEALMFVSSEFLKELPDTSDELKKNIAVMCCRIHLSVEEQSENFYS